MTQPTNHVSIRRAGENDRKVIEQMLPSYLTEMGCEPEYRYLPHYWNDPARIPYLIESQSEVIGFALVRRFSAPDYHHVAEFYIAPEHRSKRAGARAAQLLFSAHPGAWNLGVMPKNVAAIEFWSRVTAQYSNVRPSTVESGKWVLDFYVNK